MHISDIALECSRRCAQLALKCTNEEVATELNVLAVRLMVAAAKDAELLVDQTRTGDGQPPFPATAPVGSEPSAA